MSDRTFVFIHTKRLHCKKTLNFIVAIPTHDDDVEFEVENKKNVNDLKEGEIHIL